MELWGAIFTKWRATAIEIQWIALDESDSKNSSHKST
jgi:hypothetical protein